MTPVESSESDATILERHLMTILESSFTIVICLQYRPQVWYSKSFLQSLSCDRFKVGGARST
jgi:hypothetical protein